MSVNVLTERRWVVDDFARVAEIVTGDEREPVVFAIEFKVNPITRKQLAAMRDAFNKVLDDAPERKVLTLR